MATVKLTAFFDFFELYMFIFLVLSVGMTKFQSELPDEMEQSPVTHVQLSAALKHACESGEEALAFLSLARSAHILKQQNPDYITIPGRNHEQYVHIFLPRIFFNFLTFLQRSTNFLTVKPMGRYDTVTRTIVRTLPTCMGDTNACAYVCIMMSDHVGRPEVNHDCFIILWDEGMF